jgi:hypothetical protein
VTVVGANICTHAVGTPGDLGVIWYPIMNSFHLDTTHLHSIARIPLDAMRIYEDTLKLSIALDVAERPQ